MNSSDDRRIANLRPLIPPAILIEDYPLLTDSTAEKTVLSARQEIDAILQGKSDKLLVIVGPCSIHDPIAAIEYAKKLKNVADKLKENLLIVMRVYFEKPRTTTGWKGLINDPSINDSFEINKGLKIARSLLLQINELGLPTGCEFLDTISPQFIADLVSWGAIGARTTESQVHRELASGLSCPVGFKNGTDGNVNIAIDAIRAASAGHHFLSVTKQGLSAIVETTGNSSCHIILRGSTTGPNFSLQHVQKTLDKLNTALPSKKNFVMIDCSHGNSKKKHENQHLVVESVCEMVEKHSNLGILGVMIESHLVAGRQNIPSTGAKDLTYGQSITDACIGWEETEKVLNQLSECVEVKRLRTLKEI